MVSAAIPGLSRSGSANTISKAITTAPCAVAIACPNILFPYARETVSDIISRAGFQPVLLAPVNFEALYRQRLEQQAQQPSGEIPIQ